MSGLDSSGAVDGGRIRSAAANLVREDEPEMGELVTMLQDRFGVSERTIRDELNRCFDAELLYRDADRDDVEVRSP